MAIVGRRNADRVELTGSAAVSDIIFPNAEVRGCAIELCLSDIPCITIDWHVRVLNRGKVFFWGASPRA